MFHVSIDYLFEVGCIKLQNNLRLLLQQHLEMFFILQMRWESERLAITRNNKKVNTNSSFIAEYHRKTTTQIQQNKLKIRNLISPDTLGCGSIDVMFMDDERSAVWTTAGTFSAFVARDCNIWIKTQTLSQQY